MTDERIDLSMVSKEYDYMIVYSETDEPNTVNTWVLPGGSFQMNYKSMKERGCKIHNVFRRLNEKDLLDTLLNW